MRFFTTVVVLSLARFGSPSPVPVVKWVTEYHYKTVTVGYDAYTAYLATKDNTVNLQSTTETTSTAATQKTTSTYNENYTQNVPQTKSTETPSSTIVSSTSSITNVETTSSSTIVDSSSTGSIFSGEGTYYDPDMGACGQVNSASDYIVALSHALFDEFTPNGNPNKNTLCGKKLRASYEGKSVDVTVVDRCVGCARNDLDLSPSAFSQIADEALGRINLQWQWLE